MTELTPEARAMLEAGSQNDEPTDEDGKRVQRALLATFGGAASVTSASAASAVATASVSAGTVGVATKVVVVLVVASLAGVGTHSILSTSEPSHAASGRTQPQAPRVSAGSKMPTEAATHAAEPLDDEQSPNSVPREQPRRDSAPSVTLRLGADVELLREAREQALAGDHAGALRTIAVHRRQFSSSSLAVERDAIEVVALCSLGRITEARSMAANLLRSEPDSPLATSLRAACPQGSL